MRIVNLKQLCEEPDGIVFAQIKENYEIDFILGLQIKFDSFIYNEGIHFNGIGYLNPQPCERDNFQENIEYTSETFYVDTSDHDFRDDKADKFAVYNKAEIQMMIETLKNALDMQNAFNVNDLYKFR